MNTYDPMDGIVYRHMNPQGNVGSVPITGTPPIHRLPSGYANGSPRTYLRAGRRRSPAAQADVLTPSAAGKSGDPAPGRR